MQTLVEAFGAIFRYLIVSNAGLSAEEVAFIQRWEREKLWLLGRYTSKVLSVILPISTIAISILSPAPQRYAQIPTHMLMSAIALYWAYRHEKLKALTPWITLSLTTIPAVGYGIAIALAFAQGADINSVVFLVAVQSAIAVFTITHFPFANGSVLLWAGALFLIAVSSISTDHSIVLSRIEQMSAFTIIIATWFRYSVVQSIRNQALTEFTVRRMIVEEHREKSGDVERQLREAEELQSSFTSGFEHSNIPGLTIDIYHNRAERLATAWCAVRHLPQGETVLFLVDATTLGVQAGLLIHSLQALWVLSLTASNFAPEAWLGTASRALGAVSEDVESAISLSLVVLEKNCACLYATHSSYLWLIEDRDGALETSYLTQDMNKNIGVITKGVTKREFALKSSNDKSIIVTTKNVFSDDLASTEQTLKGIRAKVVAGQKNIFEPNISVTERTADRLVVWVSYAEAS